MVVPRQFGSNIVTDPILGYVAGAQFGCWRASMGATSGALWMGGHSMYASMELSLTGPRAISGRGMHEYGPLPNLSGGGTGHGSIIGLDSSEAACGEPRGDSKENGEDVGVDEGV